MESSSAAIWFRYIIHIPCVVSSAAQPYHLVMGQLRGMERAYIPWVTFGHSLSLNYSCGIPPLELGICLITCNLTETGEHTWELSWITSSQSQGYIKDQDISLQGDNDYCFQIFWWLRANLFPNGLKEKGFTSTEQNIKITDFRQYKRKLFTRNYTKLKLVASLQVFNHWLMFF